MLSISQHVTDWKSCTRCPLHKTRDQVCLYRSNVFPPIGNTFLNPPFLNSPISVLFIGEAPGDSEDALGEPFVGPAGQLLNRIIAAAEKQAFNRGNEYRQGFQPFSFAITNIVACIPRFSTTEDSGNFDSEDLSIPEIGNPQSEHILACRPRLREFVQLCHPKLIVILGNVAKNNLPFEKHGNNLLIPFKKVISLKPVQRGRTWVVPEKQITKTETVPLLHLVHPAWINHQPEHKQGLEISRCVVSLSEAIKKVL